MWRIITLFFKIAQLITPDCERKFSRALVKFSITSSPHPHRENHFFIGSTFQYWCNKNPIPQHKLITHLFIPLVRENIFHGADNRLARQRRLPDQFQNIHPMFLSQLDRFENRSEEHTSELQS